MKSFTMSSSDVKTVANVKTVFNLWFFFCSISRYTQTFWNLKDVFVVNKEFTNLLFMFKTNLNFHEIQKSKKKRNCLKIFRDDLLSFKWVLACEWVQTWSGRLAPATDTLAYLRLNQCVCVCVVDCQRMVLCAEWNRLNIRRPNTN